MFAIATLISSIDDIPNAITLANSIRLYSKSKIICLISPSVSSYQEIEDTYDIVVQLPKLTYDMRWYILSMDQYDKILYIDTNTIVVNTIDTLFLHSIPTVFNNSVYLIQPSKFAMNMYIQSNIDDINTFYEMNGYTWNRYTYNDIFLQYTTKPSIWKIMHDGVYLANMKYKISLENHLINILTPILGSNVQKVIKKYILLYEQAFTTKDFNPVVNYELLEAYGDRFLAGEYAWLMYRTPGIITPDQVTKIGAYFQNQYSLEKVCDYLGLEKYIIKSKSESIDIKMKSDIIEALIAVIGITWQNVYKRGDIAMYQFISQVWSTIFKIEPDRYIILYEEPNVRFKETVEKLSLNRNLVKVSEPQESGGEILITILYNNIPVGVGKASLQGVYRDTAIKNARKMAYRDALNKRSLDIIAKQ